MHDFSEGSNEKKVEGGWGGCWVQVLGLWGWDPNPQMLSPSVW